jgi:hypothetical protein
MKLIVCSSDLVAALFWSSRSNLVVVCRPGGSAWSVAWNLSLWITDVAFYQGRLFAKLLLVRRMILHEHARGRGRIHTFDGQCEPELVIFKADFQRSRWAKVTNLEDDQALFLGPCSRAICLPQYDLSGNRVWFLDDYNDYYPSWKWDSSSTSGTSDMANNRKFSSPLPTIS